MSSLQLCAAAATHSVPPAVDDELWQHARLPIFHTGIQTGDVVAIVTPESEIGWAWLCMALPHEQTSAFPPSFDPRVLAPTSQSCGV